VIFERWLLCKGLPYYTRFDHFHFLFPISTNSNCPFTSLSLNLLWFVVTTQISCEVSSLQLKNNIAKCIYKLWLLSNSLLAQTSFCKTHLQTTSTCHNTKPHHTMLIFIVYSDASWGPASHWSKLTGYKYILNY